MGIQGLLPFLKDIHERISVSEYSGQTVAVDAYCWLHKGAYGCALQLAQGTKTDVYVKYCMKRVNMMRFHNIRPILVFDGGYLPSKKAKEAERRAKRKEYRQRGKRFLLEGERSRAIDAFQKCVDVTPEMALNVMKACRDVGVQCIVAPYEADAQLAYMLTSGQVQLVVSEDSDLLVFGTDRVLFKMDCNGDGVIIRLDQLSEVKPVADFTRQNFRHMCILAGCDYLPSVPGLGLSTACKLLKRNGRDPLRVIKMLRLEGTKAVPPNYEEDFLKADYTFLYQLVFDPVTEVLTPLNSVPDDLQDEDMSFAGHHLSPRKAKGIAYGNINPLNHAIMDNYDPKAVSSEDSGISISVKCKQQVGTGGCRIQAKLGINSHSKIQSKTSGGNSQTSDANEQVVLAQYENSDSTSEATYQDSTSHKDTTMTEMCTANNVPFSSPFLSQKSVCKRQLFQHEFRLTTNSLRGTTSRHFSQKPPDIDNDQTQKRKRMSSKDSLFDSLGSSQCASMSDDQENTTEEVHNEVLTERLDLTSEEMLEAEADADNWDDGGELEVPFDSIDLLPEISEAEPACTTEARGSYRSAFKHVSHPLQSSPYWSQATQKPRVRTGLSKPRHQTRRRSNSTVNSDDSRQRTIFHHFTPLHKSSQ